MPKVPSSPQSLFIIGNPSCRKQQQRSALLRKSKTLLDPAQIARPPETIHPSISQGGASQLPPGNTKADAASHSVGNRKEQHGDRSTLRGHLKPHKPPQRPTPQV